MASPYCNDKELSRALERHSAGEARVIPVTLRLVDWDNTDLARLQAMPDNAKPVTNWSNRDEAFLSISRGIREVAKQLAERPKSTTVLAGSAPAEAPAAGVHAPLSVAARGASDHGPVSAPTPTPGASLEIPEDPVRHDSPIDIHLADGARCCAELDQPGALIRMKSPKRFGKSSLTARLLAYANGQGYRSVSIQLANGLPLAAFLKDAPTEAGVFGDHLRGLLKAVEDHPKLAAALRQVVHSSEPVKLRSEEAFKLKSLGLLVPEGNLERPRCRLYARYMAERLAA